MRTPKQPKPRPEILCPGCNKLKPLSTQGMCKSCYMKSWRAATQEARQASVQPKNGLGRCECKQPATQKVFLKFGVPAKHASKGKFYNLCDKCAALENEQERWVA